MMAPINILIAEDDEYDYESLIRKLSHLDSIGELIHVTDGEKTIQYLFQTGRYAGAAGYIKPDIILLDIMMPKLDGKEVLEKIKKDGTDEIKSIPVIIFTRVEDNFNNKKCFDLGAKGYLTKPVQLNYLIDMLIMLKLI